MPLRLSSEDVLVLMGIRERKSLEEIANDIGKSTSMAAKIVQEFITREEPLIVPPPRPHMARSHKLTVLAEEYLKVNGHLPTPLFRP